jgi:Co/Zn/Cd efflux system component
VSGSASQKLSFQAMIFTACLFPFYVLAALLTNSAAILTDLLATFFDLSALTACWLVLRLANKAHSGKYAYGLGKLENLAELLIALLQTILVIIASTRAVMRFLHPEAVEGAELGLFVTAAAVIGNGILKVAHHEGAHHPFRRFRRVGRHSHAPVRQQNARGIAPWLQG